MDEPQGTAAAARAYAGALTDFLALARALAATQWSTPSDLPGWTVQDIVSHVAGVEAGLLGRPGPKHTPDYAALPHAVDPFAQYIEVAVDVRRLWSPAQVLADLADVLDERILLLSAGEVDAEGPATTFFGSIDRLLVMRPFDVWVHEQDVRRAVGRPGNLDGAGAQVTAAAIRSMLPYVVGKRVRPGAGASVRFQVSGEITFTETVAVRDDGRASAVSDLAGEPTVTLSVPWESFALLASGRTPVSEPVVTGDAALAARVLPELTVTP